LESPFKRIKIDSEEYLRNLILYIHANPEDLKIDTDQYKYSSNKAIVSKNKTNIQKKAVLELFYGLENFIYCHHQKQNF
jgi:hypothetical protein